MGLRFLIILEILILLLGVLLLVLVELQMLQAFMVLLMVEVEEEVVQFLLVLMFGCKEHQDLVHQPFIQLLLETILMLLVVLVEH